MGALSFEPVPSRIRLDGSESEGKIKIPGLVLEKKIILYSIYQNCEGENPLDDIQLFFLQN